MRVEDFRIFEGETPLVKCIRLNFYSFIPINIYLKLEDMNPTGSLSDRSVFYIMKDRIDSGLEASITNTSGKAAISAAAYSSRLGIRSYVVIPESEYSETEARSLVTFDTQLVLVDGSKEEVVEMIEEISKKYPVINVSPEADDKYMLGIKEILDEIYSKIEKVDYVFTGINKNENIRFEKAKEMSKSSNIKLIGVTTLDEIEGNENIEKVEEYQIHEAQHMLAKQEGILRDKLSILSVAGLLKYAQEGRFEPNSNVVCIINDRETLFAQDSEAELSIVKIGNNIDELKEVMRLK